MSDSPNDKSNEVSRRGMLKWAGALAAVGVVGVGLGVGADLLLRPNTTKTTTQAVTQTTAQTVTQAVTQTTAQTVTQAVTQTVTQAPVSLSYTPPLSPQVQNTVNSLIQSRIALHQGETIGYANCVINCGGNNACILKIRMNNGVLVGVEPDDTVNAGVAREDSVLSDADLENGVLQYRPCARGYSWAAYVNSPDRILYPMQQTGARGSNNFIRITWQTALDTVANNIELMLQKYGPYSIGWPYNSMLYSAPSSSYLSYGFTGNVPIGPLSYYGVGTTTWGDPSSDMRLDSSTFMAGTYIDGFGLMSPPTLGDVDSWSGLGRPIADIFQAKFILLWGVDPTTTTQFLGPYYLRLAREKKIPVVAIDCRYTKTAEVLADQWIPIRPGTDMAMILAMCNVLFSENTFDQSFVSSNVEPTGFSKWQDYVTGSVRQYTENTTVGGGDLRCSLRDHHRPDAQTGCQPASLDKSVCLCWQDSLRRKRLPGPDSFAGDAWKHS